MVDKKTLVKVDPKKGITRQQYEDICRAIGEEPEPPKPPKAPAADDKQPSP